MQSTNNSFHYHSNGERNNYIDIIKGIAIILVVIGHCIQFGSGRSYLDSEVFFNDPLFKFIYSFHMPLFMLVSGYLFANTIKRDTNEIIKRKAGTILLPLISWNTIDLCINLLLGQKYTLSILFLSYFHALWFLRALFFCCMVVLMMNRVFKDNSYCYLALVAILHLIPNRILPNIFVFTIVYFILGYFYCSNIRGRFSSTGTQYVLFTISCITFILLLTFFKDTYYIYRSNTCIINEKYPPLTTIYINIYRYLTAATGCITILLALRYLYHKLHFVIIRALTTIGQASLCIYIINSLFNEFILVYLPFSHINYLTTIAEASIIILVSYRIYVLLKSYKISKYFFLGGR
jgi:fucose 4-O-acetylase-like acetyltransferase